MRTTLTLAVLFCLLFSLFPTFAGPRGGGGAVFVNGYIRSNGTYVSPHYRSAPDGNVYNNWSTVGNVNPYTGDPGIKLPKASIRRSGTSNASSTVPVYSEAEESNDDRESIAVRMSKARDEPVRSATEHTKANSKLSSKATTQTKQLVHADINSLTQEELISLDSACILAKSRGPASMNKCVTSHLADFAQTPKRPDLGTLSSDERQSIESACILARGNGSASLNRCLTSQMRAYAQEPKVPDLSVLTYDERQSIDSACILAKGNGPAAMNRCLAIQISQLSRAPKMPDLNSLQHEERQSIESACILAKGNGPAAMNRCYSSQFKTYIRGPKLPDLSGLTYAERQSIDSACILAQSNGPTSWSKCLRSQLRSLNLKTIKG